MGAELLLLAIRIAAAVALYGFVALLFVYLRRDLRLASRVTYSTPNAVLRILDGIDPLGLRQLQRSNEIGRAADNDIVLDDETVSSHHARIMYQGGQWWVEDLASRNGTAVNDVQVESPLVITYQDEIRMGRVLCRLEEGGAPTVDQG